MTWLITGGAGYIGAHVVRAMTDAGERVVVLDDLSTGIADRLPDGRTAGRAAPPWTASCWSATLAEHARHRRGPPRGEEAGRRVRRAARCATTARTSAASRPCWRRSAGAGVARFVFSSSAAVYGMPGRGPRHRGHPVRADEPVRRDQARRRVAGPGGGPGARHRHGLPALLQRGGRRAPRNWPTPASSTSSRWSSSGSPAARPRGSSATTTRPRTAPASATTSTSTTSPTPTSRRPARLAARRRRGDLTVNIGRGEGVSVREMVDLIGEVTGDHRPALVEPRRPGDAAARRRLGRAGRQGAGLDGAARGARDGRVGLGRAGGCTTAAEPAAGIMAAL